MKNKHGNIDQLSPYMNFNNKIVPVFIPSFPIDKKINKSEKLRNIIEENIDLINSISSNGKFIIHHLIYRLILSKN